MISSFTLQLTITIEVLDVCCLLIDSIYFSMNMHDSERSLVFFNQSNRLQSCYFGISGGEGDRTPDLVLAKHALSQLSYTPNKTVLGNED